MKFVMYKVNTRGRRGRAEERPDFEKLLVTLAASMFCILIVVQCIIAATGSGNSITADGGPEGAPLGAEEYLYDEGLLTLQLENVGADDDIKVLINGEEAGSFDSERLDLIVKDGDVVEVDASSISYPFDVRIVELSHNISPVSTSTSIPINSNVTEIIKIDMQ